MAVWIPKKVHAKIKPKAHPTSPAIGPSRVVLEFGRIKPRHTQVYLLCLAFNCFFCHFDQMTSIVPPYAPHTNVDVRRDRLHPPHPTPRCTCNARMYVYAYTPPPRCIDTTFPRILICTMATDGSAADASKIEIGSIYPTMERLRAAAAKQTNAYVAGVAWGVMCDLEGAGDLLLPRHSYSGHIVELWKIADWLKNDIEQLKVKLGRRPGCTWALYGDSRRILLDQWQGSWSCFFYFIIILICTSFWRIPVFGRRPFQRKSRGPAERLRQLNTSL